MPTRSSNPQATEEYVRGDLVRLGLPKRTAEIKCNGQIVPVTLNLAAALQQVRHRRGVRRLRADALCINQADDEEKGSAGFSNGANLQVCQACIGLTGRPRPEASIQYFPRHAMGQQAS